MVRLVGNDKTSLNAQQGGGLPGSNDDVDGNNKPDPMLPPRPEDGLLQLLRLLQAAGTPVTLGPQTLNVSTSHTGE